MTTDSSNSRPLIPGAHGSPSEITEENLHCIPVDWHYAENRPWLASEVSDSAFHAWISRMFPTYVEDKGNQSWPTQRRVEACNRLWQDGEIWGVTYVELAQTAQANTTLTIPRTKKEAYQQLRQLAPAGSIIQVSEPRIFGERDRLLSFAVVCSNERLQDINALASRIFDMPVEEVSEQPGVYAVRARDTGKQPGGSFVATLSFKLYRRPDAFRYRLDTSNQPAKEEKGTPS